MDSSEDHRGSLVVFCVGFESGMSDLAEKLSIWQAKWGLRAKMVGCC